MGALLDTFYLQSCFFLSYVLSLLLRFSLTRVIKLDRSMSVKVSDTSWFPGGENDAFPALQHFMEIQRLRFTMTYSKRYFALSFFSSKIAPPFFFGRSSDVLLSPNGNVDSNHKKCLFQKLINQNVKGALLLLMHLQWHE